MTDRTLVATLPKNMRENIQVSLGEFKGIQLCDVRVFADVAEGEPVATKKGLSVQPRLLPALIEALQQADAEARRLGISEVAT